MNRINEIVGMCHLPCTDLTHKSGAGARMNAPRSLGTVAQAGRSMIEMLGVLAIIGVLTIGGLMGYRYAMNKHKANLILNDVSLAMADLTVQDPDGGAIARQAVAFNPESGLAMESERTEDGNNIVYVNGVAKAVCQILIQIKPTDAYENIYDGDLNALTSCSDNQTMAFGSKDSDVPPVTKECQNDSDCDADQVCQNGQCVDKPEPTDPCEDVECFNGGTCNEGSCDCIDGYTGTNCEIEPDCNDSKPCTSPKQCENYICVCPMINTPNECQEVQKINGCDVLVNKTNATCGTNGFCSNGACTECTLPKVVNAAKDGCECPKIANCKEYNDSTCECNKCEDGYAWNASTKQCEEQKTKCGSYTCPTGWTCTTGDVLGTQVCQTSLTTASVTDSIECADTCVSATISAEVFWLVSASAADNNGLGSGEGLYLMLDGTYLGKDCTASSISEGVRTRCQTLYNAWKTFLKAN